jgi:hypothetical protein
VTREYSSISVETTLNSAINTTATNIVLPSIAAATALLGGVTLAPGNVDIFTVALDHDTVNEEIVYVTGISGDTLTISRGQAGTGTPGVSGIAHGAGASVKHVLTSDDLIFFRNSASPVPSLGFSGSTSGTTTVQATAIAGTNTLTLPPTSNDTLVARATTDTLTNKTLTAPVISTITNTGTLTLPTSTDTLVGRATTDTLTNKTLTAPVVTVALNAQTATYTAVLGDASKLVTMSVATANDFLIPTNANVAFPIGTVINVAQIGAGKTTIEAVTPGTTTVSSTAGVDPDLRAQFSVASCIKTATDAWLVTGDIS